MQRLKAKTTLTEDKAKGLNDALTEALKQVLTGKLTVQKTEDGRAI